MQFRRSIPMLVVTLACCLPAIAADGHPPAQQGVQELSAPLREALNAEMVALQNGLMRAIPALVSGNWGEVARIGRQMRDSYIMQQALSEDQLKELHAALPASFVELDARFHYLADMLSHAAEARKPELVGYYLGSIAETCVNCHTRHAQAKFPAFSAAEVGHEHDH